MSLSRGYWLFCYSMTASIVFADDVKTENPQAADDVGGIQIQVIGLSEKNKVTVVVDQVAYPAETVTVGDLRVGRHIIHIQRDKRDDVVFTIPVYSQEMTTAQVFIDQDRLLSEQQTLAYEYETRQKRDNVWWKYTGGGTCVAGSVFLLGLGFILSASGSANTPDGLPLFFAAAGGGVGACAAGCAGITWGIRDHVLPVEEPPAQGLYIHAVVLVPPAKYGLPSTLQLVDTNIVVDAIEIEKSVQSQINPTTIALPMLH